MTEITPRIRIGNQPQVKVRLRVTPALLPMEIELQNNGTVIQWRYLGQDWQDLIEIDDINTSITIGTVTTLPAGSPATVTNVGTPQNPVFNFGIPQGIQGIQGEAATIAVGTVTTVDAGVPADVTNVGTPNDAVFDFDIPQGEAATVAIGTVTTVGPFAPATVTNVGTSGAAVLNFEIPKGDDGLVVSVVAGANITVDSTDPANPVVSSSAAGVTDGDKGDIVVSSSGAAWNFDSAVVTAAARTVLDDATTAAMLSTLGGQPLDSDLTSWAGVTRAAGFDAFVATPSSANLAALVTGETGSGALVFGTSPTLTSPALGTPSAIVLTNATGLTTSGIAAATLVTAAETIGSNNNDTTIPTSAAVKAYADSVAGGLSAASQSDQETATSNTVAVTPGRQQYHPSAAKVWCSAGVTGNLLSIYNITSVTDNGPGDITFTFNVDFSSADYSALISYYNTTPINLLIGFVSSTAKAAGVIRAVMANAGLTPTDPIQWHFVAYGDQ